MVIPMATRDIFSNPWVFTAATQGEGMGTAYLQHGTFTSANATEISTMAAHGLTTGNGPVRLTGADLPSGLAIATDYWIARIDATTFYFCASHANAVAATPVPVALADDGTGTQNVVMLPLFNHKVYIETIIFEAAGAGGTYEAHDIAGGRTLTGLLTLGANTHTQIVIDAPVRGVYVTTMTDGRCVVYHGEV